MNREWNKTRKKHRRSDRTWVNLQSYSLSYRTTPASSRKSEISVLIQMSNSIALLVVYYTIMHSSYITYLYSSGGGHLVWKFLPTSYFIIGFGSFKLLNKILVIRSLKTVCNFCYLTKYERFRHFFYFIEIARFWWVLAKKCKKLFLFIIKFTTKVDLTGVSKIRLIVHLQMAAKVEKRSARADAPRRRGGGDARLCRRNQINMLMTS